MSSARAGVPEVVLCVPPDRSGRPPAIILAAIALRMADDLDADPVDILEAAIGALDDLEVKRHVRN